MDNCNHLSKYQYNDALPTWANAYLWPPLKKIIGKKFSERRALICDAEMESTANMLSTLGFDVSDVDISVSGIALGRKNYPHLKLAIGNVYDDLA